MGRKLSPALKKVIQDLVFQGHNTVKISTILTNTYNFYVSRQGIRYFMKKISERGPAETSEIQV